MRVRLTQGIALLSTGALAGAFGYGAANLVPTFNAVPLDMRLSFHTELMKMNGITMQGAMGLSVLSALALAVMTRGTARWLASGAGLLALVSFLITRLGNVPINGRIKEWAATSAPADHAEILSRWEAFNYARTGAAFAAFALLILLALRPRGSGLDSKQTAQAASKRVRRRAARVG
ncbi:anthrone oxygenase family protein [Streptomyces sp. DSM 116496]|uniref:anthrone oxygenase family protein n=1 Tax=Streptomyces stoeckheimensis TaxID=3344656 RepID=UPI0038B40984